MVIGEALAALLALAVVGPALLWNLAVSTIGRCDHCPDTVPEEWVS